MERAYPYYHVRYEKGEICVGLPLNLIFNINCNFPKNDLTINASTYNFRDFPLSDKHPAHVTRIGKYS